MVDGLGDQEYDLHWLLGARDDGDSDIEQPLLHAERPRPVRKHTCHKRYGRPSVDLVFPTVIDTARAFVESNGFEAHRRRHLTTGNCGVSLQQIRDHLFASVPGLKDRFPQLGLKMIHRWMIAPNKRNNASSDYRGLIDAKVASKKNSSNAMREDTHYCRERAKNSLELLADLGEISAAISMDNKNKVHIGEATLAVDRRLQPGRFFPITDAPDYFDHDFPSPGYLITPAGYLVMEPGAKQVYKDDKGREHLRFRRSGTTHVVNRPPGIPTTIEAHMTDLLPLLQDLVRRGRTAAFLIVDNGADFNPRSHVNQYFLGKVWKDAGLDTMGVVSYAAGDSKLNPIERVWGVLTKKLCGVYLSDILPGESRPPRQQQLPAGELQEKEKAVFNQALGLLQDYLEGLEFDGHPIHTRHITAHATHQPSLPSVQTALSSLRQLQQHPQVMESFYFSSSHLRRMDGMLLFSKCTSTTCLHCTRHPIQHQEAYEAFQKFTTPVLSSQDTYKTYLQMKATQHPPPPDASMPSRQVDSLGKCSRCPCYLFCNKADKLWHNRLFH
ncbi:uncharacterized protein LOC135156137 [Lytechinus pictus]|uniref:uncharacterized protein LOC135156137 n=1 Tax=Lytechinus pictus TaxID=7653 RepID=UPI0030B9D463